MAKTIADFGFEIDRYLFTGQSRSAHGAPRSACAGTASFPTRGPPSDEAAVVSHKSVLYVLSPPMDQHKTVAYSAAVLCVSSKR